MKIYKCLMTKLKFHINCIRYLRQKTSIWMKLEEMFIRNGIELMACKGYKIIELFVGLYSYMIKL